MRPLLLLLFSAVPAFPQLFSVGVKGGLPLTDFVNAASGSNPAGFIDFATHTNRYIIGATGELRLPLGFSIEADVLFRHFGYQEATQAVDVVSKANTTSNDWEFPLLGKYRFLHTKFARPYVDAGVAFDTLQGLTQTVSNTLVGSNATMTTSTGSPSQLQNSFTHGYVFGGGLDIKILIVHIQPEIRYTRWGPGHFFDPSGLLHNNENQGEFLLGVTF